MMERPGSCRPRPALCQLGKSPPSIGSPAGMKDYGVLKNSVEYVSTVVLCWAKGKYEDHTETLKCFLSLGEKGQIPVYISTVDMRDWIISKARSIPRERFQMEPIQTDGLIHLAWEVNMRLKLQNICRDLGLSLSSPPALSNLETQRAALSDLACLPAVTAPARFSSFYFDPQPVVERAVREIIEELAQPPTSRLHTVAEVVMDTVADLSCALLEGGEELSGRLLSDMAVAVTVLVLQELEGVEQCEVQLWRQVRPRLVGALCGELLETVSPKDLQRALRGKWDAESRTVTAAIITSVTAAVNSVLAQPDATPGSSLETAVDAAEEAKEVETVLVDVAAPSIQMETAADAAAEAEQVETVLVDVAAPSIQMETAADAAAEAEAEEVEIVLVDAAAPSIQMDLLQDEKSAIEKSAITPGDAHGDNQLSGLQKKKKKKRGVRRFFSRLWRAVRRSCCCCVSVEAE